MTSFIEQIAPYAIKHGQANGIKASVIIAQACLESAWGKSSLAVNANNLFGIKASNWTGETFSVVTGEYDSNKKYFEIVAKFRKYPTYEGAVIDLCHKLANGTGWESFNRYQAIIGETDYKKVTQALYDCGYASDYRYPEKLNKLIEQYDLTKYDKEMTPQMTRIALDAGHGLFTAGKRSPAPNSINEWTFNNKVVIAAINRLNQYQNVQILRTDDPTGKTDVSLATRSKKANDWNADVFVSCHHNALSGAWHSGGGVETFTFSTASKTTKNIAQSIHSRVVKAMGLKDRGLKTANFQVLRETKMASVLVEGGFMDSTVDMVAMRDDDKLRAQGVAIADGIASYYGLKLKTVAHSPSKPTPIQPKPQSQQPTQPTQTTKESVRMLKSTSATLNNGYTKYLEDAVKAGYIQDKWVKLFKAGQLQFDDAFLLDIHIREAKENKKK